MLSVYCKKQTWSSPFKCRSAVSSKHWKPPHWTLACVSRCVSLEQTGVHGQRTRTRARVVHHLPNGLRQDDKHVREAQPVSVTYRKCTQSIRESNPGHWRHDNTVHIALLCSVFWIIKHYRHEGCCCAQCIAVCTIHQQNVFVYCTANGWGVEVRVLHISSCLCVQHYLLWTLWVRRYPAVGCTQGSRCWTYWEYSLWDRTKGLASMNRQLKTVVRGTETILGNLKHLIGLLQAGASIPIYRWRQMRHGQFWGESIKRLILSFNIQKCEFCAQI